MLSFEQVTLIIEQKSIFTNISMTFLPSSIVYFQGTNGCGKTSLLRIVANIQNPTSGNILYRTLNCKYLKKPYCNYIGHNLGLKSQTTVLEYLRFWSTIYDSLETLESSVHYFKLYNILHEKCYRLSAGNQKKVALAKLIACQSNLWLLDEVEANLDQENKELLYNLMISKANNGGVILATSHSNIDIKSAQIINLEDYLLLNK
ncbi:MAG: heme ABC exporter ATP-binding protein CcmA [Rickettsia endosymbiont of Culicoides impunctatus]|uniref:heme ABC exporter ATP-binding protein CcmA n=1 Tax=unclassified Candidatus Tisiphia TaxID=2996318 RepID=UPI001E6E630F|nr:MAG: heme ABC exporter ATP-binding protein CcmA [Rickettsia endosymbiont of Culicoides impunctatus]